MESIPIHPPVWQRLHLSASGVLWWPSAQYGKHFFPKLCIPSVTCIKSWDPLTHLHSSQQPARTPVNMTKTSPSALPQLQTFQLSRKVRGQSERWQTPPLHGVLGQSPILLLFVCYPHSRVASGGHGLEARGSVEAHLRWDHSHYLEGLLDATLFFLSWDRSARE